MAHVVAIEDVGVPPDGVQALLEQAGDRGLACARKSCEPQHAGLLTFQPRASRLVDLERLPPDVLRSPQRKMEKSRTDRGVRDAIDQDEPAEIAVVPVCFENDGTIELDRADADLVH